MMMMMMMMMMEERKKEEEKREEREEEKKRRKRRKGWLQWERGHGTLKNTYWFSSLAPGRRRNMMFIIIINPWSSGSSSCIDWNPPSYLVNPHPMISMDGSGWIRTREDRAEEDRTRQTDYRQIDRQTTETRGMKRSI
jgi:hypothetical protein